MITFPTYDRSTMKIHKGALQARKLPFSLRQKGASQAEKGSLLHGVNSLEEPTGDLQRTQSGQLLVD